MIATLTAGMLVAATTAAPLGVSAPPGFAVFDAFPGVTFEHPVQVVFLPGGRAFVAEQRGIVWTIRADGSRPFPPFIDLTDEVRTGNDLGLLSVAIDPDFIETPWVYLAYTADPDADGVDNEAFQYARVSRYRASAVNPDVADLSTREILIGETWGDGIPSLSLSHTIGTLRFAPDGTLLVSMGDGAHFHVTDPGGLDAGAFGPGLLDPAEDLGAFRAQTLNSLAGKILRVDRATGLGLGSNPFWDGDPASNRSRVWTYGLRNPFRFSIRPGTGSSDPADGDPGTLFVGEVGWSDYEELNVIATGGDNRGWPCFEGPEPHESYPLVDETAAGNEHVLCGAAPSPENPVAPSGPAAFWHQQDPEASNPSGWVGRTAIGGVFYTGSSYPAMYQGRYFLADFSNGWLRALEVNASGEVVDWDDFLADSGGFADIEVDPVSGDVFYVAVLEGTVRRIRFLDTVETPGGIAPPPGESLALSASPSPFTRSTTVAFTLPAGARVTIGIFDSAGRRVRRLLADVARASGTHEIAWDGLAEAGTPCEPGVYFCRIEALGQVAARKVVKRR